MNVRIHRFLRLSVICLLFYGCDINSSLSAEQSPLERIERLVEKLEAAEAGHDAGISLENLSKQLTQAEEELAAYLHTHPDDIRALIMSARLGRSQQVMEPMVLTPGQEPPDPKAAYAPLHSNLDQALALQPNNAEAHYWKARLYGVRNPVIREGRIYYVAVDLDRAIDSARAAVKIAPDNVAYREALALYLVEAQHPEEAIKVMRQVAKGHHPIYRLLVDLQALPIPKTAILFPEDSESFAQQQMARGRFKDYPHLRVRMYVVPMPAAELEAFYSSHWAGFQFFHKESNKISKESEIRLFVQHLSEKQGGMQPATSNSQIPESPSAGLLFTVMELRNLPPEMRQQSPAGRSLPPNVGDVFCYLTVVNFRPLD